MKFNANGGLFVIISENNFSCKKRRNYIYFDHLLFLLPIMQQRDTSGNNNLPPSVNESEAEDTTGNRVGERSHAKDAVYRPQKKDSKTTCEKSLL